VPTASVTEVGTWVTVETSEAGAGDAAAALADTARSATAAAATARPRSLPLRREVLAFGCGSRIM
jgi:hypothetical protein